MRRAPSVPPELPGYRYVRLLGSGGFSDVFLYDQQLPKRRVAVKVLLTEELTPASRAAFVAEANVMAQLSAHPYIVSIFHAGVSEDGRPYLVMEYAPGASLAERYKREPFSVEDALRTGVRLSSAIATAHAAGILHRDIKPANVLTNDFGWPALTDFGIASAVDEETLPIHTGTLADALNDTASASSGRSVGMSVPWSPPEMFEDDPRPDVRSDVFSLAATIYTILAGHTPFEVLGRSNGTLDLINRIERGAITPMAREDVPAALVAVLAKGMATDPARRFQSAVEFARALQRIEMELGYVPTAIDVPNLVVEHARSERQAEDADATRARGVATVEAQPAPDVPPTRARGVTPVLPRSPVGPALARPEPAGPVPAASVPEATVIRARSATQGEAEAPAAAPEPGRVEATVLRSRPATVDPEPAPEPAGAAPGRRTPRAAIAAAAAGAALLVAAIVVVLTLVHGGASPGPSATPHVGAGGDGGIDLSTVPTPVAGQITDDGTSVTFTWSNPKPEDGDSYLWARSETPDSRTTTTAATATVTGVVPGSRTCIDVVVLRDGQTSSEPLRMCDR